MVASDTVWRVSRAVRRYGVVGALRQAVHRARRLPAMRRSARREAEFDRRYGGIDTAGIVHLGRLEIPGSNRDFGVSYQGVPPGRFRDLVGALPIAYEKFTFVDLGSGKGRALVLAAELPFRRIIGVEFSHELHDIAVANVEHLRERGVPPAAGRIEPVWLDAAQFEFPVEPLVVHFYNPFYGVVLTQVLDNLRASVEAAPRDVLLCFTGDVPAEARDGQGFAAVATESRQPDVYRAVPGDPVTPST